MHQERSSAATLPCALNGLAKVLKWRIFEQKVVWLWHEVMWGLPRGTSGSGRTLRIILRPRIGRSGYAFGCQRSRKPCCPRPFGWIVWLVGCRRFRRLSEAGLRRDQQDRPTGHDRPEKTHYLASFYGDTPLQTPAAEFITRDKQLATTYSIIGVCPINSCVGRQGP